MWWRTPGGEGSGSSRSLQMICVEGRCWIKPHTRRPGKGDHGPRLLQRRPAFAKGDVQIAGLEGPIINEPTAAVPAYGLDKEDRSRRSWSSTSAAAPSTSLCWRSATGCSRSRRPPATTTSAATTGTRRSSTGWSAEFKSDQGIDLARQELLQRLYEAAEKAKIELSTTQETQINLPFITADQNGPSTSR